jgi:uncharacterized NAD(P)/FAD-binding protein YdhS
MADNLAIVGLGPSNVNLIAQLVEQTRTLEQLSGSPLPPKTLYLIDHEGNHGTGKAWGRHAHPSMLFSHTVGGFSDGFTDWLKNKEDTWMPKLEAHRDGALKTWFEQNADALAQKDYGKVHFPRMTYGMFMKEKLFDTLQDLPKSLNVVMLDGKVASVGANEIGNELAFEKPATEVTLIKGDDGVISVQPKEGTTLTSLTVDMDVIGVGPPEPKPFAAMQGNPDYFHNSTELHSAREGDNFADQFKQAVMEKYRESGKKVEVGILGAGLSFLDMVNLIYNDKELKDAVSLSSISSTGYTRTVQEAQEGKQKDMAPESQAALNGLDVKFIAAKVEDLQAATDGTGITVKTSNKHLDEPDAKYREGARSDKIEHRFDIVVQAIGFGKWKEQGVFKSAYNAGIFKEDTTIRALNIDTEQKIAPTHYINGFVAEKVIGDAIKRRGLESQGFLNNVYRNSPVLAANIMREMYSEQIQNIGENLQGSITQQPEIERFGKAEAKAQEKAV